MYSRHNPIFIVLSKGNMRMQVFKSWLNGKKSSNLKNVRICSARTIVWLCTYNAAPFKQNGKGVDCDVCEAA